MSVTSGIRPDGKYQCSLTVAGPRSLESTFFSKETPLMNLDLKFKLFTEIQVNISECVFICILCAFFCESNEKLLHFHSIFQKHSTDNFHCYPLSAKILSRRSTFTETINKSTHNVVDIFTGNAIFLHPLFKEVNSQFQTKVLFLQLCNLLQMYIVTIYSFNNQYIYVCECVCVCVYISHEITLKCG